MLRVQNVVIKLLVLFSVFNATALAAAPLSALNELQAMPQASLYLAGEPEYNLRVDKPMIPASTLKILTALLALNHWGEEHRFITDFYLDSQQFLWVKAYGDPYLTSEELDSIVVQLKRKGLKRIAGVGVDSQYFADNLVIDGRSSTDNPYDAPLSALAVNFNTMEVKRDKAGIHSAEVQTPSTPLMLRLGKQLPFGKRRINLKEQGHGGQYFAQVLIEKLKQQGLEVNGSIVEGEVAGSTSLFYRHHNSKTLAQMVSGMLQYSNNFIANQLFLMMGAERYGAPADMDKAQRAYSAKVKALFAWDKSFYEGAGLSRNNQLSGMELVAILQQFAPYKDLLKPQNTRILAKTGTLREVSTYAGYLYRVNQWQPFAIMINQRVKGNFRKRLALELLN